MAFATTTPRLAGGRYLWLVSRKGAVAMTFRIQSQFNGSDGAVNGCCQEETSSYEDTRLAQGAKDTADLWFGQSQGRVLAQCRPKVGRVSNAPICDTICLDLQCKPHEIRASKLQLIKKSQPRDPLMPSLDLVAGTERSALCHQLRTRQDSVENRAAGQSSKGFESAQGRGFKCQT